MPGTSVSHGTTRASSDDTVSRLDQLIAAIRQADRTADPTWKARLSDRKLDEWEYHDHSHSPAEVASRETGRSNKKFYTTVQLSNDYLRNWISQHAPGKVFLDYACGIGSQCLLAAECGAALAVGIDISPVSIAVAQEKSSAQGLHSNTIFVQGDCERTGFPDNTFDVVLCSGMLHHLDLSYALPELRRIMKPGAVLLAVEALNYNPAIKLYRRLTPHLRTAWERDHILTLADLRFASRFFEVRNLRFWHLVSILATPLRRTSVFPIALRMANAIDKILLRVPGLRRLAWLFTFELVKRASDR